LTPHAKLLAEICAYLAAQGCWYVRTNSHGYGRRGIPDVVACVNGQFLAIEAKVPPDKASTWQEREIQSIHRAGGSAVVAYNIKTVEAIVEQLLP
jgi:Holliday junction resolvase